MSSLSCDDWWRRQRELGVWRSSVLNPMELHEPSILGLSSRFVDYRVETTTNERVYAVRRRYSDFELLRDSLCKRYVGLSLPLLPGKQVLTYGAASESALRVDTGTSGVRRSRRF